MKTSITSLLTIASLFAFGSSEAGGNRCGNNCNLVEVLSGYSDFSALVAAVKAAGLVDTLVGPGPLHRLCSTDSVFKSLPPATLIAVASDPPTLKTLLLRHVIPEATSSPRTSP
ncbi:Uncharacterized protein FKW44_015731 [Caligus rogercresseyi]|uniref:FAS1 domain-containing protein n=1 Tax=Caligus rogercresseyi TaxID=217165 RepID=A0A7T8JZW5_CALRO|nr:Uncharacterized protein FKW44_015731 [Caligus rogercresseyi]